MKNFIKLNPWFVTGYTDAEGTFVTSIYKSFTKIGWAVQLKFSLVASNNPANLRLFQSLQTFFSGGRISQNILRFVVTDLPTLLKVRDHFNKFPLQSTKWVNFQLWNQVLDMMVAKEH
jgi:LAGLIDADG endonuclease